MKPRRVLQQMIGISGLLVCPVAVGQAPIEPPVVSPGARSLGLGGAFVSVADDATAAYVNPSGLMQLLRPEISVELRAWNDERGGLESNVSSLGFASFVYPLQRWSLAIYGQTLASLDFDSAWWGREDEIDPSSSLVIVNLGFSAAVQLSEAVSVGLGIAVFAGDSTEAGIDGPWTSGSFSSDDVSTDTGVNAGVLWSLSDAWGFGASFRSGTDFTFANGRQATLPDILAAGARWRSKKDSVTLTAEVERLAGIEDRVRLHVGGEFAFLSVKPLIALRAGLWHDPKGGVATSDGQYLPSADEGVSHAAAGIGIAFKKFQLDLGADFSDRTTIASISGIFTF